MRRRVIRAVAAVSGLALLTGGLTTATPATATTTSRNLIVNGNAEGGVGRPVPGWDPGPGLGIQGHVYGEDGAPAFTDPGPVNRGTALFDGGWPPVGEDERIESASQTTSLTAYAAAIQAGTARYSLTGFLGGYNDQRDNATLEIHFLGRGDVVRGSARIGPVTPTDRGQLRGLLRRSATGVVPKGTRTVLITLTLRRFDGGYNDGYADNLSLTITTP